MEEPGYPSARQAFMAAGAQLIPVPVDQDGMNVAEIIRRGRNARAVYITPSHQYPLGMTMGATRRMLLLNWAVRTGAWIIEDDYDSEYQVWKPPDRFASRPGHRCEGHLCRDLQQSHVSRFAPGLRGCSQGFGTRILRRSGCRRCLFIDSLSGGLDRFHPRGTLRSPYTPDANALYGAAKSARKGDPRPDGRYARSDWCRSGDASGGTAAARHQRCGGFEEAARRGISAMPLSSCYLRPPARGGLILGYGGTNAHQIHDGIRKLRMSVLSAQA